MDELHDNNANERIHLIPVPAARLRKDFSVKLVKGVESRWGSC